MRLERFLWDLEFVFLNVFVNRIPSWTLRSFFYKLCGMKIGKGARIGIGTVIYYPKGIILGNRAIINEYCYLDGRFGIEINHDVGISAYVKILTGTHIVNSPQFRYSGSKVIIRHHAWLGTAAIILNGSRISENAVVGAGSVFKGICAANDIIVGNPGKVIKKRMVNLSYIMDYAPYFR